MSEIRKFASNVFLIHACSLTRTSGRGVFTQAGALIHAAVQQQRVGGAHMHSCALIHAAASDACVSLVPKISWRSFTQTGAVIYVAA